MMITTHARHPAGHLWRHPHCHFDVRGFYIVSMCPCEYVSVVVYVLVSMYSQYGESTRCRKLNIRGAILWGVLFAAIVAWYATAVIAWPVSLGYTRPTITNHRIPGHAASYLGSGSPVPGGALRQEQIQQVVAVPQFSGTLFQFDFSGFSSGSLWLALITFLYVDFLDGTEMVVAPWQCFPHHQGPLSHTCIMQSMLHRLH